MEKYTLIILYLFLLVSLTTQLTMAQQITEDINCKSQLSISTEFMAIDKMINGNPYPQLSKYQWPYLREDDSLLIKQINIINKGDCSSEASILTYDIQYPDNTLRKDGFCNFIYIPPILPNESYHFYYLNSTKFMYDNTYYYKNYYMDSINKTNYFFCFTEKMNKVGLARISEKLTPSQNYGAIIFYDGLLGDGDFKVLSTTDSLSQDLQEASIKLSRRSVVITTAIGLITLLFMWIIYRKTILEEYKREGRKQLSLLDSLYSELEALSSKKRNFVLSYGKITMEGNLQWVKKYVGARFLHEVWHLNTSLYIQGLDKVIKGVNTKPLKDLLILISQKLEIIRNILSSYDLTKDVDIKKSFVDTVDEAQKLISDAKNITRKLINMEESVGLNSYKRRIMGKLKKLFKKFNT